MTLAAIYPKGHEHRVSHETIYNFIYAQPVGELKRELIATLRHAHNKRVPRSKGQDRRGQIADMVSIHVRPPEIEKIASSPATGKVTSSRERPTPVRWARWSSAPTRTGVAVYFSDLHSP